MSTGPLPGGVRDIAERHLGVDLAGTRIEAGAVGRARADLHSANAVTEGSTISMGRGRLTTFTPAGRTLLGHELTHVAQQHAHGSVAVQCEQTEQMTGDGFKGTRDEFKSALAGKTLDVEILSTDPRLKGVDLSRVDKNADGSISTQAEFDALFTSVDELDSDGNRDTVAIWNTDGSANNVTAALRAIKDAVTADLGPVSWGMHTEDGGIDSAIGGSYFDPETGVSVPQLLSASPQIDSQHQIYAGSNSQKSVDAPDHEWLDWIQGGLEVVGLIPAVGIIPDLINGTISLARGNYAEAGLNYMSAIPLYGYGANLTKLAMRNSDNIAKLAPKVVRGNSDNIAKLTTNLVHGVRGKVHGIRRGGSTVLGKNMMRSFGLPVSKLRGFQAHHLFPTELADHPVLKKVGLLLNHESNGALLRATGKTEEVVATATHQGSHPVYTSAVKRLLDNLDVNMNVGDLSKEVAVLQQSLKAAVGNGLPLGYRSTALTKEIRSQILKKGPMQFRPKLSSKKFGGQVPAISEARLIKEISRWKERLVKQIDNDLIR